MLTLDQWFQLLFLLLSLVLAIVRLVRAIKACCNTTNKKPRCPPGKQQKKKAKITAKKILKKSGKKYLCVMVTESPYIMYREYHADREHYKVMFNHDLEHVKYYVLSNCPLHVLKSNSCRSDQPRQQHYDSVLGKWFDEYKIVNSNESNKLNLE